MMNFELNLGPDWEWSGNRLYYQGPYRLAFLEIINDEYYLYANIHHARQFKFLLKRLIAANIHFYLIEANSDNPKVRHYWFGRVVKAYLVSLLNPTMYQIFQELEWEATASLVDYLQKNDCMDLLYELYHEMLPQIEETGWNNVTGEYSFRIQEEEIRDNYRGLLRDIQIQLIL